MVAKRNKRAVNNAILTAEDTIGITEDELEKYTEQELRDIVKRQGKAVRQRVDRLRKADELDTSGYEDVIRRHGGVPASRGAKTKEELIKRVLDASRILKSERGKVPGAREFREKVVKDYENEYGLDFGGDDEKRKRIAAGLLNIANIDDEQFYDQAKAELIEEGEDVNWSTVDDKIQEIKERNRKAIEDIQSTFDGDASGFFD